MDAALDTYLEGLPAFRRERLLAIHRRIVDAHPDVDIDLRYRMPTYHLGEGWVALASQKHHVALYVCRDHLVDHFATEHPEIDCGKGCLRFQDGDELPLEAVDALIASALAGAA